MINNRQSVDGDASLRKIALRPELSRWVPRLPQNRNHKLRPGSLVASSAADLQQTLASRLKRSINLVPGASRSDIGTFKVATCATFTIRHRSEISHENKAILRSLPSQQGSGFFADPSAPCFRVQAMRAWLSCAGGQDEATHEACWVLQAGVRWMDFSGGTRTRPTSEQASEL